jgi:hypothetical protein
MEPAGTRWRAGLTLWLVGLAVLLAWSGRANAQETPAVCVIGANVESLHKLDMAFDSFDAALWVWTVCPADVARQPLETLEFPTATVIRRDAIETSALDDGRIYASQRLLGTFRFNWDMAAYPFDRHRIVIPMEDTEFEAERLTFEPDVAQSFLSHGIRDDLWEWNVSDLTISASTTQTESAYGIPGAQTSRYARADVVFELERTSIGAFLKLTSGVFAAILIAFFSFFYDPNDKGTFGGKLGLLVGVLFAVLVNMRAADATIGDAGEMTLVTLIHVVTLAFIVLLAFLALRDKLHADNDRRLPHPHWRRLSAIGVGYVLIVTGLMARAALS